MQEEQVLDYGNDMIYEGQVLNGNPHGYGSFILDGETV